MDATALGASERVLPPFHEAPQLVVRFRQAAAPACRAQSRWRLRCRNFVHSVVESATDEFVLSPTVGWAHAQQMLREAAAEGGRVAVDWVRDPLDYEWLVIAKPYLLRSRKQGQSRKARRQRGGV